MDEKAEQSVLLVEDDVELAQTMKKTLEWEGFSVCTVNDGLKAVQSFSDFPTRFGCLITDFYLSGLYCRDLIRVCLGNDLILPEKIIIISGKIELDENEFLDLGCGTFIRKPFLIDDIISKVTDILGEREFLIRDEGYRRCAREWCEDNKVPYIE